MPTARETFDELLPAALQTAPDVASAIGAVFRFEIDGPEGGVWTADLASSPPTCARGDGAEARCTIQVSDRNFARLSEGGEEVAIELLMSEQLVISGDQMLAFKLQDLFALADGDAPGGAPETPAKAPLAEMEVARRFYEYAVGFEESNRDDDWASLERFFTPDAIYDSNPGPVFGGRREGWPAIEAHFADVMNRFDRKLTRDGRFVEGPAAVPLADVPDSEGFEADEACRMRWDATYTIEGAPPLRVPGTEWALYRGGRIALLRDRIDEETNEAIAAWLAAHGHLIGWDG